jgi:hypothetical protein
MLERPRITSTLLEDCGAAVPPGAFNANIHVNCNGTAWRGKDLRNNDGKTVQGSTNFPLKDVEETSGEPSLLAAMKMSPFSDQYRAGGKSDHDY